MTAHVDTMPKKNLSGLASLTKERAAWNKVMSSTYGTKLNDGPLPLVGVDGRSTGLLLATSDLRRSLTRR